MKNGSVYEGIFHTINPDPREFGIVLKMSTMIKDGSKGPVTQRTKPIPTYVIYAKDLMSLTAAGVGLTEDVVGLERKATDDFATDAAIGRRAGAGKCVQPLPGPPWARAHAIDHRICPACPRNRT